jgi:uncharacterized protein (TIGR00369 family)
MSASPHYGETTPDSRAGLTGLELLRTMMAGGLPGPTIGRTLNFTLTEVEEGRCLFHGEPTNDFLNPLGIVHGGWALTLIDSACGCATHTVLPAGVGYTSLETKVNFTRAITPKTGRVSAEGRVISRGRQIITAEATVKDAGGRLLAHGTSTLLVLRPETKAEQPKGEQNA